LNVTELRIILFPICRYNNYKHDPLSKCSCEPPYSAENAISARSDLNPANGSYPFSFLGHRNHGGTDCKVGLTFCLTLMYRSIPKPPIPPPRANSRAFDFFEKFRSNSPLCCQFRRSNAPPVRALKRVKSPTLQAC